MVLDWDVESTNAVNVFADGFEWNLWRMFSRIVPVGVAISAIVAITPAVVAIIPAVVAGSSTPDASLSTSRLRKAAVLFGFRLDRRWTVERSNDSLGSRRGCCGWRAGRIIVGHQSES